MKVKQEKVRKFLSKQIQELSSIVADLDDLVTEIGTEYYRVAIFGSARIQENTPEYKSVYNLAKSLAQNGADIEIFESADGIAAGASGNPVAALYPRFSINNSPYSFLTAQSYFFAEKLYSQMPNAYMQTGLLFSHSNDYQAQWIEEMKHLNRNDLFEIIDIEKMKKVYGFESHGLLVKKGGYYFLI